jgi:undecaprenyl-diphosphatase
MGSIACYGMLAFLGARLLRRWRHKLALALLAAILIVGIGLSRVYFGVHFPTDVLGGFVAGAIWLVVSIELVRVAEWYAARRSARARGNNE